MTVTWDQIVTIVRNRQLTQHLLLDRMIEVRRRYNADWVIPVPGADENMPLATPSLIADAIDFVGMRAASVMPYIASPAVDLTRDTGVRSRQFANVRRKILGATHHKSRTPLHLRRAMRHLAGYATTSLLVVPDFKICQPRLELRDPLTTYPEPKAPEDLTASANVAFVYAKSAEWVASAYPEAAHLVAARPHRNREVLWEMVEWVDEDCTVIGLLGPRDDESRTLGSQGQTVGTKELRRWDNPTGICPAYIPTRVTLDRIGSQIANLTGQVDLMNQLQALAIAASEKAIFKDRYIIGESARPPVLVSGEWKDGRTGEVNIITDAKVLGELAGTPDPSTQQMIDRMERNVRVSSGLVPQAGGESYGALRTGRGMDSLMGAAVDPRVQELQEIMGVALEHANTVILETYKAYWPDKKYTVFSGWQGDKTTVEFTPATHIETTENVVSYTIPGSDVQGTTIQLGQLLGMDAISLHTLRSRHPYVDDPDAESARVEEEKLEQAALTGLANQVASGALPITYLAKVEKHRKTEPDILAAILAADAEMKAEQAKMAPPPGEGQHAAPEQMPGLSGPPPVPPSAPPPGPEGAPPGGPMPPGMGPGGPMPPGMGPGGMPPADQMMGPNAQVGEVGPTENQRGMRRLLEALSQRPPAR